MNMQRAICCAGMLPAGMFLAVQAADSVFPAATGDLAESSAWGEVSHASSDDWMLTSKDGRYTISADISFYSLSWTKPAVIDCTAAETVPVITCTGESGLGLFPGGYRSQGNDRYESNCGTLQIKGGVWDFQGRTGARAIKAYNRGNNATLLLTDGAVITNSASCQVNYQSSNSLILRDRSEYHLDAISLRFRDGSGSRSLFELSGGSNSSFPAGTPAICASTTVENSPPISSSGRGRRFRTS